VHTILDPQCTRTTSVKRCASFSMLAIKALHGLGNVGLTAFGSKCQHLSTKKIEAEAPESLSSLLPTIAFNEGAGVSD
jgi:hypothetical protein